MELLDAKNVYTLTSLAFEGRLLNRVQVVLQSHAFAPNAVALSDQDPWQRALTGGWLTLAQPFVIERHGADWCPKSFSAERSASRFTVAPSSR